MTATAIETRDPETPHGRFRGLWPQRLLHHRTPHWWQELVLIGIGYYLYREARNLVPNQPSIALRHGRSVQWLQDRLHFNFELSLNHFVDRNEWLAQIMDYYYATMHFIVTIVVLVWLFVARQRVYRGLRTALFSMTLIGLAGFYLYPLAPPRLLPLYGYVDTLAKYHTWGSLADPNVAEHTNQFAAMPSLHIAWAVWCAIAAFYCARRTWVRALGVLYPFATLLVIVGTANHFVIDAVGGLVAVAGGFAVQWLMSGHAAHEPAPEPALEAAPYSGPRAARPTHPGSTHPGSTHPTPAHPEPPPHLSSQSALLRSGPLRTGHRPSRLTRRSSVRQPDEPA